MQVLWSENGELVTITTDDSFYILKYNADVVASTPETSNKVSEDGIEDAFDVSSFLNSYLHIKNFLKC